MSLNIIFLYPDLEVLAWRKGSSDALDEGPAPFWH